VLNQIVLGGQHRHPNILKKGTIVAFMRNKHYSAVPGLEQAGKWTDYTTWTFLHTYQLFTLKRLSKTSAQAGGRREPLRPGA
jgi:hypothetical protein